mmetsp:Transcript_17332/g.43588  ORF Transcript_17332/g.43588 Transcript_17332/m.43588 type:complete len:210 (-) Transcript_17332:1132-1761(-)
MYPVRVHQLRLSSRAQQHRAARLQRLHKGALADLAQAPPGDNVPEDGHGKEDRRHQRDGPDAGERPLEGGYGLEVRGARRQQPVRVVPEDVLAAGREGGARGAEHLHASDAGVHGVHNVGLEPHPEGVPFPAPGVRRLPPAGEAKVGHQQRQPEQRRALEGQERKHQHDRTAERVRGQEERAAEEVRGELGLALGCGGLCGASLGWTRL